MLETVHPDVELAVATGALRRGPNPTKLVRVRGHYTTLRLSNAALGQTWGFERASIEGRVVGKDRASKV